MKVEIELNVPEGYEAEYSHQTPEYKRVVSVVFVLRKKTRKVIVFVPDSVERTYFKVIPADISLFDAKSLCRREVREEPAV